MIPIISETTLGARVDGKALVDDNMIKAVDECQQVLITRINRPWLMSDFIFNLSSQKTKLTKALKTATKLTDEVSINKSLYGISSILGAINFITTIINIRLNM